MSFNLSKNGLYNQVFMTRNPEDVQTTVVHIRKQIRRGRACYTFVEGLAIDLNLDAIVKYLKKTLATNGIKRKDDILGEVLQFQGDFRTSIANFLVTHNICERKLIQLHGE